MGDVLGDVLVVAGFALFSAAVGIGGALWLAGRVRGRISGSDYRDWIRSPEFAALERELARRRGSRSAVTGRPARLGSRPGDLRAHHWTYRNVGGPEYLHQLVLVTKPEHDRIHAMSERWFGEHTRALWFTTAWVVGWGKLWALVRPGHSHRPPSRSVPPQAPGHFASRTALPPGPDQVESGRRP